MAIVDIITYINNLISNIQSNITNSVNNAKDHATSQVNTLNSAVTAYVANSNKAAQDQINYLNSTLNNKIAATQVDANSKIASLNSVVNSAVYNTSKQVSDLSASFTAQVKNVTDLTFKNAQVQTELIGKIISEKQKETAATVEKILKEVVGQKTADRREKEESLFNWFYGLTAGNPSVRGQLDQFVSGQVESLLSPITDSVNGQVDKITELLEDIRLGNFTSLDELQRRFDSIFQGRDLIGSIMYILAFIPGLLEILNIMFEPYIEQIKRLVIDKNRLTLLDVNDYIRFFQIGAIQYPELQELAGKQGITDDDLLNLLNLSWEKFDVNTIRQLWYRGLLSPHELETNLKLLGYSSDAIKRLVALFNVEPPINDLITFAVREVFSPEQASTLGLYQDFPDTFANKAARQGISTETARQYWAAHWQLPSPQMAFEMFHRRIINKDTLASLLKALDYAPVWRDKLINLSYSPLTRVDVRRMYGLGVLTAEQVYESYLDIGYSPVNARRLMEFTIKYETADDESQLSELRRLTQGTIVKAYSRGALTREQAIARLIDIKYVREDAELILNLADYDNEIEKTPDRGNEINTKITSFVIKGYTNGLVPYDEALDILVEFGYLKTDAIQELSIADLTRTTNVKEQVVKEAIGGYIENTYNDVELRTILDAFGFTSTEISNQISLAVPYKTIRTKKPTYVQLIKMAEQEIITIDDLTDELRGLGYAEKYIPMLLRLEGFI